MNITNKQIVDICAIIDVEARNLKLEYTNKNHPEVSLLDRKIFITNTNDWREIYQFSHEALHLSFFDHNEQKDTTKCNWIEEVVCEAFSLYCLHLFAKDEIRFWWNYMRPDFYLKYCGINQAKKITSLEHLNKCLLDVKDFETLQYIHPYVLCILNVLSESPDNLKSFLCYTKTVKGNCITANNNCKISFILQKIQTAANNVRN